MSAQKTLKTRKVRAIVIKEKSVGESNKQLTVLAKDEGKLIVTARGAKNQKSKFFSGSQAFSYSDFVLYDGNSFLSVTQMELIKNFSASYNDIYKLMYGSYFLELIDRTVMFSQESNDIMLLLLKSLHMLEKSGDVKKISAAFQLKLLVYLGLCPETVCTICGSKSRLCYSEASFSRYEGFLCDKCAQTGMNTVSPGTMEAVRYISTAETGSIFMFTVSEKILEELHSVAEVIIRSHLDSDSKCLEIIKKL